MNWLKDRSNSLPNKKFINSMTYKEVFEAMIGIASNMKNIIGNEKRIAIISNNSIEFALVILAAMNLKVEVLLLNSRLKDDEINDRLKELKIAVVFSEDNKFISFKELFNKKSKSMELSLDFDDQEDRIVFIMNTSATTGKFKSVPITLSSIKAHVKASKDMLGYIEDDNWLLVLPMFHIGGLAILLRSLFNGTAVTIVDKFNEGKVLELINSRKVNMASMIPTMFRRVVDGIEHHNLRVMLLSGEFADDALVHKGINKNIPIYKSYGMTETTSQITCFNVKENVEKIKSVGKPLMLSEVKINITDRSEVNEDGYPIGEILLKAPMIMKGYIGKEEVSGYFNTGDIGYVDNENFLYILDRRSNLIISGGENIYPLEIENVLYKNEEIKECAVIGKEDKVWGKVPVLYVVTKLSENEIIEYLKVHLANYKIPKKIIFKDSLPKNNTGKIARMLLGSEA